MSDSPKLRDWSPQKAIGVALTVIFFVGFVVPVGASGAFLNWVQFLKDYQTMIGGCAAILAAYVTIHAMMATDREAERRHRELVLLTQRSDALAVERAVNPQMSDLKRELEGLETLRNRMGTRPEAINVFHSESETRFSHVASILNRPQFRDGSRLFDGALNQKVASLQRLVDTILNLDKRPLPLHRYTEEAGWVRHTPAPDDEQRVRASVYYGIYNDVVQAVSELVVALDAVEHSYRELGAWPG